MHVVCCNSPGQANLIFSPLPPVTPSPPHPPPPPPHQLQCSPGQTVQQVIETEIPDLAHYQVYQFPSRALLNPEKDARVLQDQEISIEPMRMTSPGNEEGGREGGREGELVAA